jgi:dTDP-4-amino-4,6-dideoxygalactose transaminase
MLNREPCSPTPAEAEHPAIPTQDLVAHNQPLRSELQAAMWRVLVSGRYIDGPEVAAFEREAAAALEVAHAVGVSSGTDAILALLMACGVDAGDEVVTTPFSFFASAGGIVRLGATPIFADIEADTLNLDAELAASRIGPRTRAVLTVHLFGRSARTEPLELACGAAGIPLLEDAAQAIGARREGRPVGTIGRAAALSFFPSKNLGGFGDGGMIITGDAGLAARLRRLRVHGAQPRYHHELVGGNFRLDELQAALLRVKLPHLAGWSARRAQIARRYRAGLAGLPIALPPEDPGCVWNQFVIRVPDGRRDALRLHLASRKIASAIYYPQPLHLQPCFAQLGYRRGDCPQAERACAEVLALPIYPELAPAAIDRVCDVIRGLFERS